MKLNQREQKALRALEIVVESVRNQNPNLTMFITEGDASALLDVFGWDLKATTTSKGDLAKAVRGKESPLLEISGYGPKGGYDRQCFFPFQVKARKVKQESEETIRRKEQERALVAQLRKVIFAKTVNKQNGDEEIHALGNMLREVK